MYFNEILPNYILNKITTAIDLIYLFHIQLWVKPITELNMFYAYFNKIDCNRGNLF